MEPMETANKATAYGRIELRFPVGTEIQYKFTNSGPSGEWNPGEEFPSGNRRVFLDGSIDRVVLTDKFGKM